MCKCVCVCVCVCEGDGGEKKQQALYFFSTKLSIAAQQNTVICSHKFKSRCNVHNFTPMPSFRFSSNARAMMREIKGGERERKSERASERKEEEKGE